MKPRSILDLLPPNLGEDRSRSRVVPFQFTVKASRRGAALPTLNWILSILEASCAPVEEVGFEYFDSGAVTAVVCLGRGWVIPDRFSELIGLLESSPHTAPFDLFPRHSALLAAALADPERFEEIGNHLRADLLAGVERHIPKVRCPCAEPLPPTRGDVATTFEKLRDGLLRWRPRGGDS